MDKRGYEFNTKEDAIEHEKELIEREEDELVEVLNGYLEVGRENILDWIREKGFWSQFEKDFEVEIEQAKKYYLLDYVDDIWEEDEFEDA